MEILEVIQEHVLGADLRERYINAKPFPHIVIDDFFRRDFVLKILAEFPSEGGYAEFDSGYAGKLKTAFKPDSVPLEASTKLFFLANHPKFLTLLESITGIQGLIPDPYYEGGGFHATRQGGKLGIHADFRIHRKLNLSRRINIILYLNDVWEEHWDGNLELWDRNATSCVAEVSPILNRVIIFNTDATSYHGHPRELRCPPEIVRKSVALYYYTASASVYKEVPNNNTNYVDDGSLGRAERIALRGKYMLWKFIPPIAVELLEGLRNMTSRMKK